MTQGHCKPRFIRALKSFMAIVNYIYTLQCVDYVKIGYHINYEVCSWNLYFICVAKVVCLPLWSDWPHFSSRGLPALLYLPILNIFTLTLVLWFGHWSMCFCLIPNGIAISNVTNRLINYYSSLFSSLHIFCTIRSIYRTKKFAVLKHLLGNNLCNQAQSATYVWDKADENSLRVLMKNYQL